MTTVQIRKKRSYTSLVYGLQRQCQGESLLLGVMLVCTAPISGTIPGTPRPRPVPLDSASRRYAQLRRWNQAVGLRIPAAAVQPVSCHAAVANMILAMHRPQYQFLMMSLKKPTMMHYYQTILWLPVDGGQSYIPCMHL
jgi:hypothetical protein